MWHFEISPPWDSNEGYISKCVIRLCISINKSSLRQTNTSVISNELRRLVSERGMFEDVLRHQLEAGLNGAFLGMKPDLVSVS